MANIPEEQIDGLQQLLSEYHSSHEREQGPMERCQDPACVEAKLGLRFLDGKNESDTLNLR